MPDLADVEAIVLALSENERAILVTRLLESLPAPLYDEDEGIAEALRRDAELDKDPDSGMSLEEFERRMKQRLR